MKFDWQLILALIYAAQGKETRNREDTIFKVYSFCYSLFSSFFNVGTCNNLNLNLSLELMTSFFINVAKPHHVL